MIKEEYTSLYKVPDYAAKTVVRRIATKVRGGKPDGDE